MFNKRYLIISGIFHTGQKQRQWCGDLSNPPGIFLATRADVNPFINVPILQDWIFDFSVEIFAFFMTNPGNHVTPDMQIDFTQDVLGFKNVTLRLHDYLLDLNKALRNFTSNSLTIIFNDAKVKLAEIDKAVKEVLSVVSQRKYTQIPDIVSNLWKNISNFDQAVEHLEDELNQFKNGTIGMTKTFLRNELTYLKERISKVIYKIKNQITNALKDFSGAGFKFRSDLRILGLKLGGIDVELVYSNDALMRCSRFQAVSKLLQGQPALRVLGRGSYEQSLGYFISADIGGGVGFAMAMHSHDMIAQLNAHINILGIKVTGDVFIARDGVRFYIEGNMWDVFYVQLDCHAGSIGRDWHALEFVVKGRLVAKSRKKRHIDTRIQTLAGLDVLRKTRKRRQTQTDANDFQASYLDALRKVTRNVADIADKRLSQAKVAISKAQEKLTKAQHWLDDKKKDVRKANGAFDSAVRSLDKAKDKLEAAKGPFRRAIEKLNSAQRKVDHLCKIRHCNRVCVPGIKCRICHKKVGWAKIPYPCCRKTSCMISFPNPLCEVANAACRVVRKVAYAALSVAKAFVRLPMIALDAAKFAVSAAQVVVDKSRIVLKVAEGALEVAKLGLGALKLTLENAKLALEGLKVIIGAAAKVLDFVLKYGLQNLIDVRNCGFMVKLSTVDIAVMDVGCDINAFKLGWQKVEVRINFKNIVQSLWNAAKAAIKGLMHMIGHVFTGRRRREIEADVTSKMHIFLRQIRSAADPLNATFATLNNTYNTLSFVNETEGFAEHSITDYDNRVLTFHAKCTGMKRHLSFLQDTLGVLHDIATESKHSLDLADKLHSDADDSSDALVDANFTAENLGINVSYAHHYNLTGDEIEKALVGAKPTLDNDQHLAELRNMSTFAKEMTNIEVMNMDLGGITETWMLALENITQLHFNDSECADFRDCVLFSISTMYDIYAVGDNANMSTIRIILTDLEDSILDIVGNSSFNVYGIHNATTQIRGDLQLVEDMNIFCTEPPEMVSPIRNVTTVWGGNATFFCKIRSEAEVTYWWYKGDDVIPGESSSVLTVNNVTESKDSYRCEAGNVVANISSDKAFVTIVTLDTRKSW